MDRGVSDAIQPGIGGLPARSTAQMWVPLHYIMTSRCRQVVLAFIVNEAEEILLLAHPERKGAWEVVNGLLESGETILAGALREIREEAGPGLRVRPLGTVHAYTFHYDENVPYMVGLCYLMAYGGGNVEPGDDMYGSA